MTLGRNIQYLRKEKQLTQEAFAERMQVSRQIVSKWETDEVVPELSRLIEMCDFFSCKLDALVRENLTNWQDIYSAVRIEKLPAFTMARYLIVSPNPEDDVQHYMREWGRKAGLLQAHPQAKLIGWDWPYVTPEQQNRFGLRGYVAAYILPDDFNASYPGVELAKQIEAKYAVITINEPTLAPFERIPNAYRKLMEHLGANGFKEKPCEDVLSCFEYEYEKGGINYMDVYIHVNAVIDSNAFTSFGG